MRGQALAQTLDAEGAQLLVSATVSVPAAARGAELPPEVVAAVRSAINVLVAAAEPVS